MNAIYCTLYVVFAVLTAGITWGMYRGDIEIEMGVGNVITCALAGVFWPALWVVYPAILIATLIVRLGNKIGNYLEKVTMWVFGD